MFIGEMRPYQGPAMERAAARGRFLLAHAMGSGKTPTAIATIEKLAAEGKVHCCLVVVMSGIKYQWQSAVQQFCDGRSLVIDGTAAQRRSLYKLAPLSRYVILSYGTVVADWKYVRRLSYDCVLLDECFPAGTLVDTPSGPVPIETVGVGDVVLNAVGCGQVRNVMERRVDVLVRVCFDSGEEVVCTPNHLFFTKEGWHPASMLQHGDSVIRHSEAVRLVQGGDARAPTNWDAHWSVLRDELLSEVEDAPAGSSSQGVHSREKREDRSGVTRLATVAITGRTVSVGSYGTFTVDGRECGQIYRDVAGEWKCYTAARGERYWTDSNGERVTGAPESCLEVELRDLVGEASTWVPHELQGRLGTAFAEVGSRGRWQLASNAFASSSGREEDSDAGVSRVDRVEVLERGSPAWTRAGGDSDTVHVYNLEVEGHPSYSVAGMLVHNCSMIKNNKAQRTRMIKKLGDGIKYRFAMTGTPIENRPEDLWSIMEFVDPSVLGDPETFERTFIVRDGNGRFKYARNLKTLHRALSDAMDRKSYDEIKQWMPSVVHKKYPVMLDPATRKVYNVIRGDLLDRLNTASKLYGGSFNVLAHYGHADSDGNDQARGDIAARMGALSMLCDSPELLRLSADAFDDDDTKFGSAYAAELKALGLLEGLPELSPKLRAFNEVIDNILTEDPAGKVVVFSFYKPMLYMAQRTTKHRSVLFTGGMPDRVREASRLAFMRDPHVKLFLSSDAGGYGVDLPMAQNLISLDLPWSAGKMDQRNSRIIRTSSQYQYVVNSRIIVAGSIEEWKSDVVLDKRNLGAAFIDGKFDKHGTYTPTAQSLRKFLQEAQV